MGFYFKDTTQNWLSINNENPYICTFENIKRMYTFFLKHQESHNQQYAATFQL